MDFERQLSDTVDMSRVVDHKVDVRRHRFPHCIVWTPIPLITWLIPIIGHMGIGTSEGVIRDFAGSYYVAEDDMGFGWPTRYLQLDLDKVVGGYTAWDKAVYEASEEYHHRMHNLFCDNCHSHVAMALNQMNYYGKSSYNMIKLTLWCGIFGRHTGICAVIKTWLPFLIVVAIIVIVSVLSGNV